MKNRYNPLTLNNYQELVSKNFVTVECKPHNEEEIISSISPIHPGRLKSYIVECANPMSYIRNKEGIDEDSCEDIQILLVHSGIAKVNQNGRNATLGPGDIVSYSAHMPFELVYETSHHTSTLKIAREDICISNKKLNDMLGIKMNKNSMTGRLASQMIRELCYAEIDLHDEDSLNLIEETFLSFIYPAIMKRGNHNDNKDDKRLRDIKSYVKSNLGDPTLCAESTSYRFGLSIRTLNRLFSNSGTTFNKWLWKVRIEECHEKLKFDSNAKITDIIYDTGFSDPSHFYRLFKQAYNKTPKEIRAKK